MTIILIALMVGLLLGGAVGFLIASIVRIAVEREP